MCIKEISEIIHNFGVGIGTLLAGGVGAKILLDWNNQASQKKRFKKFRNLYPLRNLKMDDSETGFRLLRGHPRRVDIGIYDLASNKRFRITDMDTYYGLGYRDEESKVDWEQITSLSQNLQEKYKAFEEGDSVEML